MILFLSLKKSPVNLVTLCEWEAVACAVAVVFCQVANKRWHVGESSASKANQHSYSDGHFCFDLFI